MTKRLRLISVDGLDPLDDVHRERQARDPRPAGALVGEVEPRRRRVRDRASRAPRLFSHPHEQVRLRAAHQVDVAQRAPRVAGQRRRPDEAGGAVAEQVDDVDRRRRCRPAGSSASGAARSSRCPTG